MREHLLDLLPTSPDVVNMQRGQNFYPKNLTLLYKILVRVAHGFYCAQIARQLNLRKQLVHYYLKKLEKCGFLAKIIKTNYASYKLTSEGEQLLQELKASLKNGKD